MSSVIFVAIIAGGYLSYQKLYPASASVRYLTQKAAKGMLISSISGTGQASTQNQIDLKPETSGKVSYIAVKNNQEVKRGQLLVRLDATDAARAVRDAQAGLDNAELSLERLKEPADELSVIQAENKLFQAKKSKTDAEESLEKASEDSFNKISNAFLDAPTVMNGLETIFFGDGLNRNQWNLDYCVDTVKDYNSQIIQYRNDLAALYQIARNEYEAAFENYKNTNRSADKQTAENLVAGTYNTIKSISEAVKSGSNYLSFYEDVAIQNKVAVKNEISSFKNNLANYTNTINNHLSNLLSIKNAISDSEAAIIEAELTIREKEQSLSDLKDEPDVLDLRSQELSVQQKREALADAREKLSTCGVYAPFDGIIINLDLAVGQSVSNSTAIANLISKQKIAKIALNEIDAAQIKVGQKAILEFDAIEGLSITGQVTEVDLSGEVSQGVVSYGVKIAFDVQDERIKPGMSLGVSIIIESKSDVLLAPISAVKTSNGSSYVETLVDGQPQRKTITIGSNNDTMIEIAAGLAEGERVITQTIATGGTTAVTKSGNAEIGIGSAQNQSQDAMRSMMRVMR